MSRYKVSFHESIAHYITVDANSIEEAYDKARDKYFEEDKDAVKSDTLDFVWTGTEEID